MIYIHIPFCDSKCYYCNFSSGIYDDNIKIDYINNILKEIEYFSNKKVEITSIYIGGGTPSSIPPKFIQNILNCIKNNYILSKHVEITIECNPCSLNLEKIKYYKKIGINRLSIGIQSLNNKCLKTIGRKHDKKVGLNAIKSASDYFDNINADILIGIPYQNYYKLKNTAKKIIKYVKHISCYMLINENGTKLTNLINCNCVKTVSEDNCVKYYNKLTKYLQKNQFYRYEISNFSKKGYECKHNLGYWNLTSYYGFGLSAHSYIDGKRYNNPTNMQQYLNFDFNYEKEILSKQEIIEEYIMLGLRTRDGISISKLKTLGYDIINENKNIKYLLEKNIIQINNDNLFITENYFGVSNQIILKLINF